MIFTILKIVGFIVLSLLGLLILSVLLILFCPFCYNAKGNIDKKDIIANVKITWLFRLIGIYFSYNEKTKVKIRILFFKKRMFNYQNDIDEDDNESNENSIEKNSISQQNSNEIADSTVLHVSSSEDNIRSDKNEQDEKEIKNENLKENQSKKNKKIKNGYNKIKKIFDSIINLCKKIKIFIDDQENRLAFTTIKTELLNLLKAICPKKLKLQAKYSTGAPDTTGISLGILAMFPIGYQNRWQIEPDFESDKFYIQGKFDISGKIHFYKILRIVIRLFLDKNCRKLYNKLKN